VFNILVGCAFFCFLTAVVVVLFQGNKDEDIFLVVKSLLQTVFLIVKILDRAGTLSVSKTSE